MKVVKKLWDFAFHTREGLYLVFGVLTTAVSVAVFALCAFIFGEEQLILNTVLKNAAGILFAYFTNRSMVFKSQNKTAAAKTAEFIQFAVSRVATLFVDMRIVWLLCDRLEVMRSTPASCVASAVVIVLNYFASRFIVFKKKGEKRENGEKESQ